MVANSREREFIYIIKLDLQLKFIYIFIDYLDTSDKIVLYLQVILQSNST